MKKYLKTIMLASAFTVVSNSLVFGAEKLQGFSGSELLNSVISEVNQEHKSIKKPVIDFNKYIQNYAGASSDHDKYSYDGSVNFNSNTVLTQAQMKEDLDVLFKILSSTYGGYYYFGGDATFNPAKAAILKECSNNKQITAKDFYASVFKNLSFIKDRHFTINDRAFYEVYLPHMYTSAEFEKTDEGYKNKQSGKTVAEIPGKADWQRLFKRFISKSGDLVYHPVTMAEKSPGNLTVKYTDGSSETLKHSSYNGGREEVTLSGFGNIPTIRIGSMGFDKSKNGAGARLFLEYAAKYKNEPVLIVDLRDNYGGNGVLPFKWFMAYAGALVPTNFSTLKYLNDSYLKEMCKDTANMYYIPYEELRDIAGFEPISEQYMKSNAQPDKFVENDRLLIVLVNKNAASSAEMFVDMAHNLENTLIVGTNTAGVLLGDAYKQVCLPNSALKIQLGAGISFFPDNYFQEYVGFEPDLWVDGNAEEAVNKFLNKNKL